MVRIKHAVSARRKKKRLLKKAAGQFGHRSRRYSQAKRSLLKSMSYAYRDRKNRKRAFKSLWVVRLNAACRAAGTNYSRFIKGLKTAKITIDRKILADLAVNSPEILTKLIDISKAK
ncbi:MAG: 50S ribosomal protein L20 [Candidatus Omnitrophota bacterium]